MNARSPAEPFPLSPAGRSPRGYIKPILGEGRPVLRRLCEGGGEEPDEIEQACLEQVAYWYQRRSQLGLASFSNESGIVQQFQSSDLLPQVRAVLKKYVRWAN